MNTQKHLDILDSLQAAADRATRPLTYHDGQPVQAGDTFVTGTFGTCRVLETFIYAARVRNVLTGEEWDLETHDADLLEREAPELDLAANL